MNDLIPIPPGAQLPAVITRRTEIVASTLESIEQREVMQFFREFPKLFVDCLCTHVSLEDDLLQKYAFGLNWSNLSSSPTLALNVDRLERFENNWHWLQLSMNESIPWTQELLRRFIHHRRSYSVLKRSQRRSNMTICGYISSNVGIPWTQEILREFEGELCWSSLSSNTSLPWSSALIEEFLGRWSFGSSTGPFSSGDFGYSDINRSPFKLAPLIFRSEYSGKYPWPALNRVISRGISNNPALPWSYELIEKFKGKWDWSLLSMNAGIPWSTELLERYHDRWNHRLLCANESVQWSLQTLEKPKYQHALNSEFRDDVGLRFNKTIRWTVEDYESCDELKKRYRWPGYENSFDWSLDLLREHNEHMECEGDRASKWDWTELSQNTKLPWNESFIEEFTDDIHWRAICFNPSIPWTTELIDKYSTRLDWRALSKNEHLPWSTSLFKRFSAKWDVEAVSKHQDFGLRNLNTWQISHLLKEILE